MVSKPGTALKCLQGVACCNCVFCALSRPLLCLFTARPHLFFLLQGQGAMGQQLVQAQQRPALCAQSLCNRRSSLSAHRGVAFGTFVQRGRRHRRAPGGLCIPASACELTSVTSDPNVSGRSRIVANLSLFPSLPSKQSCLACGH